MHIPARLLYQSCLSPPAVHASGREVSSFVHKRGSLIRRHTPRARRSSPRSVDEIRPAGASRPPDRSARCRRQSQLVGRSVGLLVGWSVGSPSGCLGIVLVDDVLERRSNDSAALVRSSRGPGDATTHGERRRPPGFYRCTPLLSGPLFSDLFAAASWIPPRGCASAPDA